MSVPRAQADPTSGSPSGFVATKRGIHLRSPRGDRWTVTEMVQGKPLGHPSHAMFVHFPIAFYIGALGFDLASRFGTLPAPTVGLWLLLAGLAGTVLAAGTGLVDWLGMVRGSSKRTWATKHMLVQLTATAPLVAAAVLHGLGVGAAQAAIAWIVLEALGVAVMLVGNWFGGVLVYQMGVRVSTGGR